MIAFAYIDIVFDGPPGPESGRFVEVEDDHGNSMSVGTWIDRGDGMWALRLLAPDGLPIPMRLTCPCCGELHIDEGEFATKPHHTHACQGCGNVWRPAILPTVGVRFLPGFKNDGVR